MRYFLHYIFILALLIGCNSQERDREKLVEADSIDIENLKTEIEQSTRSIFYNMFLPCEMAYIFEETGVEYNPELINPIKNRTRYSTNNKKAVNLGIYGVDLGYIKLHQQGAIIKEYVMGINRLSDELGIPDEHVIYVMDYFENNIKNVDSLYSMTCELFEITDSYLNSNERQSTSALIILGGWVEAIYITSNMMGAEPNEEIMTRIGQQKYSLNSIISLLTMYDENILITRYLVMLKSMKNVYDNIEVYYEDPSDIKIDTINKRIYTDKSKVKITENQFNEIRDIITKMRVQMVQ